MIEAFHRISVSWTSSGSDRVFGVQLLFGGLRGAIFSDLVIAGEGPSSATGDTGGSVPPIAAHIMPRIMGERRPWTHLLRSHYNRSGSPSDRNDQQGGERSGSGKKTEAFLKPYLGLSAEVLRQTKKAIAATA